MGLTEEVRFELIGRGGLAEDKSLLEVINEALQQAALVLVDPETLDGSKATITVKLVVKRLDGDGGVAVIPDVDIRWPKRRVRGLAGSVVGGTLVTVQHRQGALELRDEAGE
jgi:hypothetical protein